MKNYGQTSEDYQDSGVLSSPPSFLRSGYFAWDFASVNDRGGAGYSWSLRSATITNSYLLYFYRTRLYSQNNNNRGDGFAVR